MWKSYNINEIIKIPKLYSLFYRHRENGYSFSGESHDFWECLYISKGELRVTAGERLYILSDGDMVFHKPLEMHKYDVLSETGADILVFSFELQGEICSFFEEKVFALNYIQKDIIKSIKENINIARQTAQSAEHPHTIDCLHTLPEIMQLTVEYIKILFLQLKNDSNTVGLLTDKNTEIFKSLVGYLKKNIHRKISIKELSETFFVSESSIKRIFSKNSGLGVHSYFLKLKISEAVEYLKDGHSVTDTANKLGFCDSAYFTTAFKREMGVTPTEYLSEN